jgi:phosphoribosyl 1,2-cyclic phosphodiesterase
MRVRFLGTGASGGTAGRGRSQRRESSALISQGRTRVLIDATRHFREQRKEFTERLDAVLLTHAHRDACGGLPALAESQEAGGADDAGVPIYASKATIAAARRRLRGLEHCRFVPVRARQSRRIGPVTITPLTVPHARERWAPTFAWRLTAGGRRLVYASDVARLTPELRRFAEGAALLVIDGAMWGRQLFSHLTIDRDLPELCAWRVKRILLTQIGSTAPRHERFAREVSALCPRAAPAHDGLEVTL